MNDDRLFFPKLLNADERSLYMNLSENQNKHISKEVKPHQNSSRDFKGCFKDYLYHERLTGLREK